MGQGYHLMEMQATSTKKHLDYAIKVHELRKKYAQLSAINGISFDVYPQEIFGILGPNGAGKTTTIKCITTLTKPSSGSIEIFGINAISYPDKVRQKIGYVPQSLSLINELSGYENLLIYSKLYGVPREKRNENILNILELLGISERANDEIRKYSGGMMRRLEIGTAIVHNPSLLILDEPTIGLDPQGRRTVWNILRQLVHEFRTTIFMTTHDMSEADELCDRIAIINRGNIAAIDTPGNLKRNVGVQEGAGGEGRDVIIIKTLSNPLTVMSILDAKMGVKAEIVDNGNYNHHLGTQIEQEHYLRLVLKDGKNMFSILLSALVNAGIKVESIDIQKPTLDDVFLKYAGTRLHEAESQEQEDEGWRKVRNVRRTFRQMG